MELRDYLGALRRRWWQVCLVATFTVGAALGAGALVPPRWDSSVMLRITPATAPTSPYESVLTAEMLAKTYRELINSDYVAQSAIVQLRTRVPVDVFKRSLTVELIPDTELVRVTASARTPAEAQRMAAAVADAAIAYVKAGDTTDKVTVAIPALLPTKPVWPQPAIEAVAGLVFGLTLGVILALAFDYFGARIERASDIEDAIGVPVVGQVPRFSASESSATVFTDPTNPLAEHFRHLRTALLYSIDGQKLDVILVTSSEPTQGKTLIAANLAASLARTGKRVLLADADMRLPKAHDFFHLPNDKGLADFLLGDVSFESVVRATSFESLWVVAAGTRPDEPSELLASARFSEFLRKARAFAEIVVIDSPPALTVADSVGLAARVDGVLLVVDRQQRVDSVRRLKTTLSRVGAHMVGVVLNRAEISHEAAKSGYYYTQPRDTKQASSADATAADVDGGTGQPGS